jgi:kinesin family protein 6/9
MSFLNYLSSFLLEFSITSNNYFSIVFTPTTYIYVYIYLRILIYYIICHTIFPPFFYDCFFSSTSSLLFLFLLTVAGSERIKKTQIQGKILTEALHINLALHYLEQVIVALQKRIKDKNVHIPYRNSMMTSVLRDSLGGNCKTIMIATLSAQRSHIDESVSTCRFAARVAMVRNDAIINEEIDPKLLIRKLKSQIRDLHEEITDLKSERGEEADRELTADERDKCRQIVMDYVQSDKPTVYMGISNKFKLDACFSIFKQLINDARSNSQSQEFNTPLKPSKPSSTAGDSLKDDEEIKRLKTVIASRDNEISILVSMLKDHVKEDKGIEILENVRSRAQKKTMIEMGDTSLTSQYDTMNPLQQGLLLSKGMAQIRQIQEKHIIDMGMDQSNNGPAEVNAEDALLLELRLKSFEEFRKSYEKNQKFEEQKNTLKDKISQAQKEGEIINNCREKINTIKNQIEKRRLAMGVQNLNENDTSNENKDDQEEKLKQEIEISKNSYREHIQNLKDLKGEIEHLKSLIERSRRKLQADFELWWNEKQNRSSSSSSSSNSSSLSNTDRMEKEKDRDRVSSGGSTPTSHRLPSTGNAKADADIQRFYEMRDSLLNRK